MVYTEYTLSRGACLTSHRIGRDPAGGHYMSLLYSVIIVIVRSETEKQLEQSRSQR
jgi:hypothetical protein